MTWKAEVDGIDERKQLAQELGDIDAELEAREGMEYLQSLPSQQSAPQNTSEALDEKPPYWNIWRGRIHPNESFGASIGGGTRGLFRHWFAP